jgi:hypothetical protein
VYGFTELNLSPFGIIAIVLMGSRFFQYLTTGMGFWQEKKKLSHRDASRSVINYPTGTLRGQISVKEGALE